MFFQNLHTLRAYLKVFNVREGNSNGDHRPGVIVGEVQSFTHFSSAHSDKQGAICKKESHDVQGVWGALISWYITGPVVSELTEPHLSPQSIWLHRSRSEAAHQSPLFHHREAPWSQSSAVLASPTAPCCSSDLAVCPTSNQTTAGAWYELISVIGQHVQHRRNTMIFILVHNVDRSKVIQGSYVGHVDLKKIKMNII